jgi:hypothetical protein
MSRGVKILWPVLALLASFAVVFVITFAAGSGAPVSREQTPDPVPTVTVSTTVSPEPREEASAWVNSRELVITVVGRTDPTGQESGSPLPAVLDVLERRGEYVCLTVDPARWDWTAAEPWDEVDRRPCRRVPPGQPVELRFVPR